MSSYSAHTYALAAVMQYFDWQRCSIVTSTDAVYFFAATNFREFFAKSGIEVAYFASSNSGADMASSVAKINDLKARVVIVCGYEADIASFVWNIYRLGLLRAGWAWVSIWSSGVDNIHEELVRLAAAANEEAPSIQVLQGLLCLDFAVSPDTPEFRQFKDDVRAEMQSFGVTLAASELIDVYAGPLYDAVLLYAKSVAEAMKQGGSPRNTTAVLAAAKSISFQGMTGFVQLDPETGDRLVNTQVPDLQLHAFSIIIKAVCR